MSYHPFWLRSAVLVILRDVNRVSGGGGEGRGEE